MNGTRPILRAILILSLALVPLLLAGGCAKQRIPSGPVRMAPKAPDLRTQAQTAYEGGDFAQAEYLYSRLLEDPSLTSAERLTGLMRQGRSAMESGHPYQAMRSLEEAARLDQSVRQTWDWNQDYALALKATGKPGDARSHLASLASSTSRSWDTRSQAALLLARIKREERDFAGSLKTLGETYAKAPDPTRAFMEERFLQDLGILSEDSFQGYAQIADKTKDDDRFPIAVVRLDKARRLTLASGGHSAKAEDIFRDVRQAKKLASDRVIQTAQAAQTSQAAQAAKDPASSATPGETTPAAPLPVPAAVPAAPAAPGSFAMALPLTGRDAAIGWQVLRGVWLGQKQGGTSQFAEAIVVNTDSPDWLDKLKQLPPSVRVVGGPLRVEAYTQLKEAGLTRDRAVFAFLPGLGESREGQDAWRFFPSQEDQVRAMVELAVRDLGITRLGVLYPQERYGTHMAQLFAKVAQDSGAMVSASESYPPGETSQWGKIVSRMIKAQAKTDPKNPKDPATPFQALFIPDSWAKTQMIVPQLFFYEEDRLLLLGPEIWAQRQASEPSAAEAELDYFGLAAFPAAWSADSSSPAARNLIREAQSAKLPQPDFWMALGYDFSRLASYLRLPEAGAGGADLAGSVNAALARAQVMDFSLAPFTWSAQGVARQQMLLLAPDKTGNATINPAQLALRLEAVRLRHAERFSQDADQSKKTKP